MEPIKFNSFSPKKVNVAVRNIAEHLCLDAGNAVLLKFHRPMEFEPELQSCFFNVWVQINFKGGGFQHGWLIAQDTAKDFIEAQFHAVWVDPNGDYIDVTPRTDGQKRVMFIPDFDRQIRLTHSDGAPAIMTYDNFRMFQGQPLAQVEPIKAIMQDTQFIQKHGLLRST